MTDDPEILSRSLADANREIPELDDDQAVVSIGSTDSSTPDGFDPSNPLHLRLQFDDVTSRSPSLHAGEADPPTREDVARLIEHGERLLESGFVYCHCAAGISRSTAAAFILRCLHREAGEEREAMRAVLEDNPFASPNRRMVQLADELLERDGSMLSAIEAVSRQM